MSKVWMQTNQNYLVACINQVKTLLKHHHNSNKASNDILQIEDHLPVNNVASEGLTSVENLCLLFGLSSFEKHLVILCAAQELDSEVKTLLAEAHGNPNMQYSTFGLALSCLPNSHWSAITPTAPLRKFRLLHLYLNSHNSITNCPLHISERVLHYLTGIFYLEPELQDIIKPVFNNEQPVPSHMQHVNKILSIWRDNKSKIPMIQLCGVDKTGKLTIAHTTLTNMGLNLWQIPAELIPQNPKEASTLTQLLTRETALLNAGLIITAEDTDEQTQKNTQRFIEQLPGPFFLTTNQRWQTPNNTITLQVNKPLKTEQYQLWKTNLKNNKDKTLPNIISTLVGQFNLTVTDIKTAITQATQQHQQNNSNGRSNLTDVLWESACAISRPKISTLAQQITPKATFDDLVLPEREKQLLKDLIIHVAQRHKVYDEWGFKDVSTRGLGISALFSGSSGTGKTMAAEAIAHELHLDLFRIDLSAVISKYIGETEKNLNKLFNAAEDGGAILFFDEADALFGKRTETKDSHDRYANIEINYLLQQMENYPGLTILATNMRENLDTAFTRRLKFIINFPFPNEKNRHKIWQHIFPKKTPTDNLNFTQLAKLNITGGNIRNIALYSAFLAANENTQINMQHIKRATQVEYAKIEKPLTTEGDWQHENKH